VVALELILGLLLFADLLWIAWIVADWRNDTYEVTTNSIMDVEKKPLFFDEKRRMARLDEIENIEVNVPSFLHYLFDFGSVRLQTASSDGNFTFDLVPHPHAVAAEVQRRIEEYQTRERMIAAQRRAQELPDWFLCGFQFGLLLSTGHAGKQTQTCQQHRSQRNVSHL
jgi:abortive infection bacteriophage resistance protein